MIKKRPVKRIQVSDVIGGNFSDKEKQHHQKYGIHTPENDKMIVTDERPLTVPGFARKLKALNPRLYIHFNERIPEPDAPFGHVIRFRRDDVAEKYDFVCGVGKGGSKIIPAQSQYQHFFNNETKQYETRLEYKGWVAAETQVIAYLVSLGINK